MGRVATTLALSPSPCRTSASDESQIAQLVETDRSSTFANRVDNKQLVELLAATTAASMWTDLSRADAVTVSWRDRGMELK